MRTDYCLKTETKQETINALHSIGLVDLEGIPIYCDVAYLGPIVLENGIIDNNFHTNLLCQNPLTAEQISVLPIINPSKKLFTWA